jgi:NAD(P)-dependent dehydrogenase (short-subunit alcohol dehydrogenase family)
VKGTDVDQRLQGQVALVTGASRGIGRAVAIALGRLGARVVVNYKSATAQAEEAVRAVVDAGGSAEPAQADVARAPEARALVEKALARHGRLDILVNNAAIQRSAMLHKMSDADWNDVIDLNLSAAFHLCRAALPAMLEARRGNIVNVASASAFMAQKGAASYVASKHGLIGLTKALALETANKGLRVNCVAPGLTDTDLVRNLTDAQRGALLTMVPLGRIAAPEEVAAMVAFVIADASYSTGNVFHVGGGVVM